MSKVLVGYGIGSGCTEGIAGQIGETLEASGLEAAVAGKLGVAA